MKFKHIHFIINPASGKQEPVLTMINRTFVGTNIHWDISVTKKEISAGDIAKGLIGKTDLIAVYGGDGCVTEVASVLHGSNTPFAIIPGGTANVMAKELEIPIDTEAALKLLTNQSLQLKRMDMGLFNGRPFLLRVNIGIMADMVLQADRDLKDKIGQLAYGITAVKTVLENEPLYYSMEIDGEHIEQNGVSLTVTNSGHIGIGDFALQPGISINDGMLDVILMKDADLLSLVKVAGSTIMQNKTQALMHWKCKKIRIIMKKDQIFVCDDQEVTAKEIDILISPLSVQVVVPVTSQL